MGEQQTSFAFETAREGACLVVSVRGEVDLVTAPELERALRTASVPGTSDLIVDLSETSFFDSTGIHALLRAGAHAAPVGVRLSIVAGSSCVRRVLRIAGIDRLYDVHETMQEARLGVSEPTRRRSESAVAR